MQKVLKDAVWSPRPHVEIRMEVGKIHSHSLVNHMHWRFNCTCVCAKLSKNKVTKECKQSNKEYFSHRWSLLPSGRWRTFFTAFCSLLRLKLSKGRYYLKSSQINQSNDRWFRWNTGAVFFLFIYLISSVETLCNPCEGASCSAN